MTHTEALDVLKVRCEIWGSIVKYRFRNDAEMVRDYERVTQALTHVEAIKEILKERESNEQG